MSMFISKALRRAEVFLEQVDESVAQASRRLVVEGATDGVEEEETSSDEDEQSQQSRASAIPRADERAKVSVVEPTPVDLDTHLAEAWGEDVVIDDSMFESQESLVETTHTLAEQVDIPSTADASGTAEATNQIADFAPQWPIDAEPDIRYPQSGSGRSEIDVVTPEKPGVKSGTSTNSGTKPPNPGRLQKASRQSMSSSSLIAVADHEEYVKALREETDALRSELENVESGLEKSKREKSKMVKNLKRMKDIVSEMDETLREKSAEARKLEDALIQAKDQINALQQKTRESDARGKDGIDTLRKEFTGQIEKMEKELNVTIQENANMHEENERLKEALLAGHEVEVATADGARQEASQAHKAYEAETQAHRETRQRAKEREEALEAEAVLGAKALAAAQRKSEEHLEIASTARAAQRAAETKLVAVTSARDTAFARIEDLQQALSLYERGEDNEAPGQKEAKAMSQTVSELENALEAKNVELNRLEGELEAMRSTYRSPRHGQAPRSPIQGGRTESETHEVEVKLRHMADAALRKQAQLEALRSENRALQHQLTTERKRTREAQALVAAASSSHKTIRGGFRGILDTGEEHGERMYGIRDGPLARFRTPRSWPRGISKVVIGVDRFCAQALAFLRREPLLRMAILLYIIGMHIFVYSLMHWHVDTISGSIEHPHASIASAKSGGQMKRGVV